MSAELLYPLIGGSLSALGAALLLWSLFRDRSRGRLRCPRCWYSMEGVPETESAARRVRTCPECGRISTSERQLRRTRRRRRWAAVALLLLIAGWGVWKFPQARARGLWSYAPTTALILLRDLAYQYRWGGSEIGAELLQRVYDGKVNSWQLASIDPPGLKELITLPLGEDAIWPEGEPLLVEFNPPGWMFLDVEAGGAPRRLEIKGHSGSTAARIRADHGNERVLSPFITLVLEGGTALWQRRSGFWTSSEVVEHAPLTTAVTAASFEWKLRAVDSDRIIWTGRRELPVRIVPRSDPELGIEPRQSEPLNRIVRHEILTGVDVESPAFRFIIGPCRDPRLADVAISICAEVLLDGQPVASLRFAAPPGGLSEIDPAAPDFEAPRSLPVAPEIPTVDLLAKADRVAIRIRPDIGALVYHGLSGPYWAGDITIPLSEILARETGP